MESRNPLIVVGVCVPERQSYASRLARAVGGHLISLAERMPPPGRQHVPLLPEHPSATPRAAGIVADVASVLDLPHLGLANDPQSSVICVVDALHLQHDLRDGEPLLQAAADGDDRADFGSRARRAVSYLEAATLISFVNWESTPTAELSLLMALASHLSPGARVRLSRGPAEDLRALRSARQEPVPLLERAGWVHALNDEHDPHMTDARVTTLRYEQPRPFHPGRLMHTLDDIDSGRLGTLLRSAGFCRLATRAGILARWDQVGSAIWIDPLSAEVETATTAQDLAFTGLDLDHEGIRNALDSAAVTDDELTAGPAAWRRFADPLPTWPVNVEEAP
ncbi:GTP-binding protein [Microbacterium sp. SA39]|uniref:GTP-binding protein n=1 Tax=Microbacterium sp. SA39 TaxID=1263625 RepID=UPI0005FA435D|nr:GTP-binding protein [Microbacterium sp. SA39]KJQ53853.1 putative metal chaperone YciC [Microbacterium sp. SA39]